MNSNQPQTPAESVSILVTTAIGGQCLQKIRAVNPGIGVTDVADLIAAEKKGDLTATEKLDVLLSGADVIFGLDLPRNVIGRADGLKWIQVISAGVEHILDPEIAESPVVITNIRGMSATPIAEFVIAVALMFAKQMPRCFQLQQTRQWQVFTTAGLGSKTMGIVGLGSIGGEVARLARSFGMRVIALRRSSGSVTDNGDVDMMLPREGLYQLLAESDFVALTVPLTTETDGLIGEKELRAMKPTAYLINVSRGNVVDEEMLIRALSENWIAGAGLDVFATEPLPVESRLWGLPNVIYSPHVSGSIENEIEMAADLFIDNLKRYLNGDRLFNVVDKKKGY